MTESSVIRRVAVRGADDGLLADTELDAVGPAHAEAIIAVGEEALTDGALSRDAVPLLPVGVDGALHSVSKPALADAAAALNRGDYRVASHPLLDVAVDGEQVGQAVFDVTLMTTEPARISEYSLSATSERLAEVRADGVVVAGSFGSAGYSSAAGGPLLAPGAGLSVVPVAPFTTRADDWVVPGPVQLAVERDEGDVTLYADADDLGAVEPHEPVRVDTAGGFDCLRPSLE
jgi:NAD+ kinase